MGVRPEAPRPLPLSALLPPAAIRLGVPAEDWRAAIVAAGEALVASGSTTPAYTQEMIATMTDLGPYLVIAPGVALAHARPSPSVLRTGLSCVTLAAPVRFGHRDNDPVVLVIGLAASDNRSHIQALATLAALLADTETRAALLAAREPAEVQAVIAAFESARAAEERSAAPVAGKGET